MHRTDKYSQIHHTYKHSLHRSIIWPVWLNGWVFVYKASVCGFESSCSHSSFVIFSIEGKIPEDENILNMRDSWLETTFLSNFNIMIGIVLGTNALLEFDEDMTCAISAWTVRL